MKRLFPDIIVSLRSIHQIIALTSLVLIIGLFSPNKGIDISLAIADLENITNLTKDWDPKVIDNAYHFQIFNPLSEELYFNNYWQIELQIEEINWLGNKELPTHVFQINAPMDLFLDWTYGYEFGDKGTVTKTPKPKSLQEFLEFWNKARRVQKIQFSVQSLLNYAYVQRNPEDPVQKIPLTILASDYTNSPEHDGYNGIFMPNIFDVNDIDERDRNLYGLTYLRSEDDPYFTKIWIPSSTNTEIIETFNATDYLCKEMEYSLDKDCDTDFEQAFPELYFFTKDIRDLSFESILIELKQMKEDEFGENINFLGFQLPSILLYGGGTVLLVLMQFYFRLHLSILNSTIKKIDELPTWIGLFPNTLSRFVTMLTANLIPFLIVVALNIQSASQKMIAKEFDLEYALIWLILVAEAFLITYVYFDFVDLWKILDADYYGNKPVKNRAGVRRRNRN